MDLMTEHRVRKGRPLVPSVKSRDSLWKSALIAMFAFILSLFLHVCFILIFIIVHVLTCRSVRADLFSAENV